MHFATHNLLFNLKAVVIKTQTQAILLAALFMMLTGNYALLNRILEVYLANIGNLSFLISFVIFFSILTTIFLMVMSRGRLSPLHQNTKSQPAWLGFFATISQLFGTLNLLYRLH